MWDIYIVIPEIDWVGTPIEGHGFHSFPGSRCKWHSRGQKFDPPVRILAAKAVAVPLAMVTAAAMTITEAKAA